MCPRSLRALAALLAASACSSANCPPNQPCLEVDGGQEFACGDTFCLQGQLCVVPSTCGNEGSYTTPGAQCVEVPPACGPIETACGCEASLASSGDGGPESDAPPQCCFFLPQQGTFEQCNFGCD